MDENISITKNGKVFTINYFNYKKETIAYFEKKQLQGGGYTWESLAKAALEIESPEILNVINFDPEGDAFYAYTENREAAEALKHIFERLSKDINYREKCILKAQVNGGLE